MPCIGKHALPGDGRAAQSTGKANAMLARYQHRPDYSERSKGSTASCFCATGYPVNLGTCLSKKLDRGKIIYQTGQVWVRSVETTWGHPLIDRFSRALATTRPGTTVNPYCLLTSLLADNIGNPILVTRNRLHQSKLLADLRAMRSLSYGKFMLALTTAFPINFLNTDVYSTR